MAVRRLLACAAAALLQPAAAWGQAVDYGTLEQMFGEPITTSATGKPQRASEVPADMVIITQDDIRRSGATSVADVLQFVPGIDVRRYNFADAEIAVRGYDVPANPRLLVLVDGRQIYADYYGLVNWNAIPVQLSEIRQIEVVKGPNSALFGFNAASGVINIVTFDPLLDKTDTLTVRGGTQGYGQGEGVFTQHIGDTAGVRVSLGGYTTTGFPHPESQQQIPPRYDSFNADGRWQASPQVLLSASGGYTDSHDAYEVPIERLTWTGGHESYIRLGAAADSRLGTVHADVYRNHGIETILSSTVDISSTIAQLADLARIDASNLVRVGLEYRTNTLTASPPAFAGTVGSEDFAASAMWDWQISPLFDLTNAVRLDHLVLHQSGSAVEIPGRTSAIYNATELTGLGFNSGLVIHATELDTFRLTAARGLELPSLFDFGGQQILIGYPGVYALGVPGLQIEAVWNTQFGYARALPAIGGALDASIFFQRNTNIIAPQATTPVLRYGATFATVAANIGSSNETGFELGLKGTTQGGMRWNASYRLAAITQDIAGTVTADQATSFARGTPVHAIILGIGYTVGRWEMDAAGRFQTQFTDYALGPAQAAVPAVVPAYVTFNARIAYRVTDRLVLAGTAQQFNVSPLLQAAGSTVDRRLIASLTLGF